MSELVALLAMIPEEFFAMIGVAVLAIGLPLSIAHARRIGRRTRDENAIEERLARVEDALEAIRHDLRRLPGRAESTTDPGRSGDYQSQS